MDRKYNQRNNNICRIYFRNIRPLSPTVLISANCNGGLILIYGRVYLFAAVRVALTGICVRIPQSKREDLIGLSRPVVKSYPNSPGFGL